MRAWRLGMSSTGLYRASGKLSRIGLRMLERRGRVRRLPPPLSGWTEARDFPPFARRSFRDRWAGRQEKGANEKRADGDE
jgi:L-lactate dehydrogenase complex protein LldF